MGCRNRDSFSDDSSSSSSSLSEALLFATMCIIGLSVDVHVKDGSIYSGIFHTASVDSDYGIILKKAKMTKKGKSKTNVGKDGLIETLVILLGDLVQVVAKGVTLPSDGVGGNITGNEEEAAEQTAPCSESQIPNTEKPKGGLMDKRHVQQSRQDGDDLMNGQIDDLRQKLEFLEEKSAEKVQGPSSSPKMDMLPAQVEFSEPGCTYMTSKTSANESHRSPASVKTDDQFAERSGLANSTSTNATQVVGLASESQNMTIKSVEISAPRSAGPTKNAKEFKLNPAAKVFSPSFVNPISAAPAVPIVPTVANVAYMPNNSPAVPIAAIQPEVGFNTFVSRPSLPVKVAQYGNLTAGNGGSGSQFSQPIVGQLAHRTQPLRYAPHYNPALSEASYLQPSSPAVMVGRSGQLVYVHPVSHDLVHGATAISPVSQRPLINLNHVQFPKQQGGAVGQPMPLCVPPPVLAGGPQPFALQNHIPLLQPSFPATRPIPVPGPNGFYSTKFT